MSGIPSAFGYVAYRARPKFPCRHGGPHCAAPDIATPQAADNSLTTSAIGPSVWTGRALQGENDDLEKVGLALLYPAH